MIQAPSSMGPAFRRDRCKGAAASGALRRQRRHSSKNCNHKNTKQEGRGGSVRIVFKTRAPGVTVLLFILNSNVDNDNGLRC